MGQAAAAEPRAKPSMLVPRPGGLLRALLLYILLSLMAGERTDCLCTRNYPLVLMPPLPSLPPPPPPRSSAVAWQLRLWQTPIRPPCCSISYNALLHIGRVGSWTDPATTSSQSAAHTARSGFEEVLRGHQQGGVGGAGGPAQHAFVVFCIGMLSLGVYQCSGTCSAAPTWTQT